MFYYYSLLISTTIFAKMADPKPLLLAAGFLERGYWHDVINFTFPGSSRFLLPVAGPGLAVISCSCEMLIGLRRRAPERIIHVLAWRIIHFFA